MDTYLEIRLLPDPEFSQHFLMGALFGKLHRALVELKANNIGLSFPDYSLAPRGLGERLRLHGTKQALSVLMEQHWLKGMSDHVQCSEVLPVPNNAQFRTVSRRQFKTSSERLRRRRMKRKGETYEQAAEAIPRHVERSPELPYVQLRSQSTGQNFHLFIEQGKLLAQPQKATFSSYGLSSMATVPWF
ncbi:type I-F CRISPR-associated endoribonuclease Cas6/Csy4 [Oceanimonas sp. CAM02]|uniref:type I-F CRISPR-associated endoribonuclease Cas6/Csy4 n=1 Tax=Oceanimonas sp. CAM02 TaxID=3080336 RepID=UPI002935EE92|nr:type I-F CRISPR-associated endoribonuclease Cas6/Csy4 [Oceanimonas sp. CAM02]MDV2857823.1 type I-F CRISPR-associated endoribonuclease Cas6/Csy4 [Oceanimonas sp. CAM02]